jgi:hypothetical protein
MSCEGFEIFVVDMLDLYEWDCGQEKCKIHSSEPKFGANRSYQCSKVERI